MAHLLPNFRPGAAFVRPRIRRITKLIYVKRAWYLGRGANFTNAFTFGHFGEDYYGLVIGIGAWLGTIMLFNVWVLIWPNQKKILGMVAATDEEKARARKVALLASRTNFFLSIPMLMCMASAAHGLPF